MAETESHVSERVAERIQMAAREVAEIRDVARSEQDPNLQIKALFDGHRAMLDALTEIVAMLATEIDRLRSHDDS